MNKGTILGFKGSWQSGIAMLVIRSKHDKIVDVPCENTSAIRALYACYGNVIGPGRTVNQRPFIGRKIFYEYNDYGLLTRFWPACEYCDDHVAVAIKDNRYICKSCLN